MDQYDASPARRARAPNNAAYCSASAPEPAGPTGRPQSQRASAV